MTQAPEIYARRRLSRRLALWQDDEPADAATCVTAMLAELDREPSGADSNDVLAALALIAAARADIDAAEAALLSRARGLGVTWQALADAMGVSSRQAVQQRAARAGVGDRAAERQPMSGTGAA